MAEKLLDSPPPGGNLTPETFLECLQAYNLAMRERDESSASVLRVGKRMKKVGISKEAFDLFMKLSKMEPDEATILLKTVIRYGQWASRPFASQQDMFHGLAIEKPKEKAAVEFTEFEIEDAGYKAGFKGQKIEDNPYSADEADSPAYVLWRRGWTNGQAALAKKAFGGEDGGGDDKVVNVTGKRGASRKRAAVH